MVVSCLVIGSYSVDATAGVVVEGLVSVGLVVVLVVAVVLVVLVRLAQTIWELSVDIAVKFSRMASPPPSANYRVSSTGQALYPSLV